MSTRIVHDYGTYIPNGQEVFPGQEEIIAFIQCLYWYQWYSGSVGTGTTGTVTVLLLVPLVW